jgi:hypothetical protein
VDHREGLGDKTGSISGTYEISYVIVRSNFTRRGRGGGETSKIVRDPLQNGSWCKGQRNTKLSS